MDPIILAIGGWVMLGVAMTTRDLSWLPASSVLFIMSIAAQSQNRQN